MGGSVSFCRGVTGNVVRMVNLYSSDIPVQRGETQQTTDSCISRNTGRRHCRHGLCLDRHGDVRNVNKVLQSLTVRFCDLTFL